MLPYWDPFGLFWQLGWLLVLPFALLAGVIWELKHKLFDRKWTYEEMRAWEEQVRNEG